MLNESKLLICIVGASAPVADAIAAWPAEVSTESWPSLQSLRQRTETTCPALILIHLEAPDQYGPDDVAWLFKQFPMSRIVCSASAWCASINRSRGIWPVSVVVSESEIHDRITLERRIIEGDVEPIPATGDREESVRPRFEAPHCGSAAGRSALVAADGSTMTAWMSDLLKSLGIRSTASSPPQPADWLIIDGDPWSEAKQQRIHIERQAVPGLPVLVVTDQLIPASHPATAAGVIPVSKFASIAEWSRVLNSVAMVLAVALMIGCGAPPAPTAPPPTSSTNTWANQLGQVRSGASRRLEFSDHLMAAQWRELKTGCDGLEILEVGDLELTDQDLEVLLSLPRLRRLVLESPVSDAGAEILSRCTALTEINLPHSQITDAGLTHLAARPLRQLRIGSSRITDAGISALKEQQELRFLHLIDVPMTDAALDSLAQIKSLQSLYLDNARCTDEGLSKFIQARPNIHFHRDQLHLPDDPGADAH